MTDRRIGPDVIGVGGSTGSMEAFAALLQTIPVDSGLAFVLVVDLKLDRESSLVSVLQKTTDLAVSLATEGEPLRPDAVYVIPPGKRLDVRHGRFRLSTRGTAEDRHSIVDQFFASLALDRQDHAVAVILSGTGTDGTLGLEAIRHAGGFALAQEAHSAEHPSMPSSAVASGFVDRILPTSQIFAAIRDQLSTRRPAVNAARGPSGGAVAKTTQRAPRDATGPASAARTKSKDPSPARATPKKPQPRRSPADVRLHDELAKTRGRLDSALKHLTISREELQSSNEELRSSNEELQSSNESLESSREELQSMNEELAVVNAQLIDKMAEVTRSSNDVTNLLTSSNIATLLLDSELCVSRFTRPSTSIFALQESDVGRPIAELRMLVSYPGFLDDARAVIALGTPMETHVRGQRDRTFIARLAPYRTQEGSTKGVVATFVDVTSLDVARTALRENAEQLRALVDHAAVGIAITDVRGRLVDVNPALCALLRSERDHLVGQPLDDYLHSEGGRLGRQLHVDLLAGRRKHYTVEERFVARDATMIWACVSVSSIQPAGGGHARAVHVIQDESEAKLAEKQLRAQEGLARLGEMAAAIAHEVRGPLVAILGAVDVLATRIPAGPTETRVVGEIRQRINSLDSLVTELLLFARPQELRFKRVNVLSLLRDTAVLLKETNELGDIEFSLTGDEAESVGDAELLRSVFVNLATNAAQAMSGRGRLAVNASSAGAVVTIVFRDTGPGVPEELARRIFEPFFTTRSRGIGLGLSLARRIIEAHGGDIALLPSRGVGATMSITLPRAASEVNAN